MYDSKNMFCVIIISYFSHAEPFSRKTSKDSHLTNKLNKYIPKIVNTQNQNIHHIQNGLISTTNRCSCGAEQQQLSQTTLKECMEINYLPSDGNTCLSWGAQLLTTVGIYGYAMTNSVLYIFYETVN